MLANELVYRAYVVEPRGCGVGVVAGGAASCPPSEANVYGL